MGMNEQLASVLGGKPSAATDVPQASATTDTRQLPEIANNGAITLQVISKVIENLQALRAAWGN